MIPDYQRLADSLRSTLEKYLPVQPMPSQSVLYRRAQMLESTRKLRAKWKAQGLSSQGKPFGTPEKRCRKKP